MAKKILIIEDEQTLLKNLQLALEEEFAVVTSITGHDGLRMAQHEGVDLIVLDVMLPDGDGIEILKALKTDERTKDVPVIVLTNLDSTAVVNRITEAGGSEFLAKADWSLDDIIKKIRSLVK